ncbi:hypothetical protein Sjap_002624 [Stephania japonica]|uniref:Uncharacterized protein n=1 Tax=Stephania japonica TaxID=461633 RepID=A0AAP0KPJ0_9MAGN
MSHLDPSNNQCETSNTTLDGDKKHVEFIDKNIVNNDDNEKVNVDIVHNKEDNVDIVHNEEDNVGIVNNVDIGNGNKDSNNEDDCDDSDDEIEAIDLLDGPKEGMIFETIDEVKAVFKRYAKAKV